MAFAGRQFQSLRRSFRRSTRKRTRDFFELEDLPKKRRSEGIENDESTGCSLEDPPPSPMRLWAGCKNMDQSKDIIEDLDLFYIKQLAISLQDEELQKKIDVEIKMREGTKKLLAACNRERQLLEASKSLLVSNARVLAYMTELQTRKTAQYTDSKRKSPRSVRKECGKRAACKGKVIVSDIRIPLFWKDVDHIKNKGDHHRYAVFCLLKIGTEINSTQLVTNVDRMATDVTFDDSFVFNNIQPEFRCTIEVYSYNLHDDMTIASTPQKLRRKINSFSNSVGKTVGRKLQASLSAGESLNTDISEKPIFHLVAKATLSVNDVNPVIKTHDLLMETDDTTRHHFLPLFGNFCCRLAAQPNCMAKSLIEGVLHMQERNEGLPVWKRNLWGILRDGHLRFYNKAEDTSASGSSNSTQTIPISMDTSVSLSSEFIPMYPHVLKVCYHKSEEHCYLATENQDEMEKWSSALEQLVTDQAAWQDACHMSVRLITQEPRRPSVESDRTGSLYDEMSISPDLTSQDDSEDENVFIDSPATNLRPRYLPFTTKRDKKPTFVIPKILVRRETNV